MTTKNAAKARKSRTRQLATIWIFTKDGRHNAANIFGRDLATEEAWSTERAWDAHRWFNPVEINIHPTDIDQAVAKWEAIAKQRGVCHVEIRDRRPGDTVNEFYA